MKQYKIKILNPVMGVPVTFVERYTPPVRNLQSSDSIKEQTTTALPSITYLDLSGMSTTSETEQISNNLSVTDEAYTSEYLLLGISEQNGVGLSGGLLTDSINRHPYINGSRRFLRLFIKKE